MKLNSKWIKDLNLRPESLNLIEENVGFSLEHISKGENFLNRTLIAQTLRIIINEQDLMKLKQQRTPSFGKSGRLQSRKDLDQLHTQKRANI